MFVHQKEVNKAGIYTIRMNVRGRPHLITIDDTLQFENNSFLFNYNPKKKPIPAYARPNPIHRSLWGPLLEKAWAKLNMNYLNMQGGTNWMMMQAMLGCPIVHMYTSTLLR